MIEEMVAHDSQSRPLKKTAVRIISVKGYSLLTTMFRCDDLKIIFI